MKNLLLLLTPLLFLSQSCSDEELPAAASAPLCRVHLAPPLHVPGGDSPPRAGRLRAFVEQSALSAEGYGSKYHLFWSTKQGIYHATRDLTGAPKDSPWLSFPRHPPTNMPPFGADSWDVEPYLGKFLLAAPSPKEPGGPLVLVSGVESPFAARRSIYLSRPQGKTRQIDLAVQGQTAAVVFSQRSLTSDKEEVYLQLVDLCVLSENASPGCSAELSPRGQLGEALPVDEADIEDGFTTSFGPPAPTEWSQSDAFLPRLLGEGHHPSVVGFEADAFLVSFRISEKELRVLRVPLDRAGLGGPLAEAVISAEDAQAAGTPLSLVRVLARVFSFPPVKGGDALQLSRLAWEGSTKLALRVEPVGLIPLGASGRFARYASVLSYHAASSQGAGEDGFAALWLGEGLLSKEGLEMHFALLSEEGKSEEAPLWVLPGEKIQDAVMAGPYRDDRGLRFGVFYQHGRPEVGMGFTQVICE